MHRRWSSTLQFLRLHQQKLAEQCVRQGQRTRCDGDLDCSINEMIRVRFAQLVSQDRWRRQSQTLVVLSLRAIADLFESQRCGCWFRVHEGRGIA